MLTLLAVCLYLVLKHHTVPEVGSEESWQQLGNLSENWSQWRELIELVFAGPDADKWTDQQKAAHFLIFVGQKGRDVCRAWQASGEITAGDKKKTDILLANDCAFYDAGDMIKDRILMGSKFKDVQEKLLQEQDLNLEKAIRIARAYEMSRKDMQVLEGTQLQINATENHSSRYGQGRTHKGICREHRIKC